MNVLYNCRGMLSVQATDTSGVHKKENKLHLLQNNQIHNLIRTCLKRVGSFLLAAQRSCPCMIRNDSAHLLFLQ